nr:hypothetical protein [Tanacetum cinerariifolium]
DQDDPHDDAHPEGENSAKSQKTSEHETFVFGESSSEQDYESKPDDDVLPNEKVSQEIVIEISQTVDEAKLSKVVDEMFMTIRNFNEVAQRLQDIMLDSLPKLVDARIKGILKTQVALHVAQWLILEREKNHADVAKMIADAIQQERENLRTKISSQVNDDIANHILSQNVKEHLLAEEIEKLVDGAENVEEYVEIASSPLRQNDNQNDLGTGLEPRSDKESPEVEITAIVQLVNVYDEEEESAEDDYELRRKE